MKISIVGAGYVGAVTGSCLAELGHSVVLVDKDLAKVQKIQNGISPIAEPCLADLIQKGTKAGRLTATQDLTGAIGAADLVLISVGTPTNKTDGSADLSAISRVIMEIRSCLKNRSEKLPIAITSTVPPGTTNGLVRQILQGDDKNSEKFVLAFIPEFLREGSAIDDFQNPSRFIIGIDNPAEVGNFLSLRPDLASRTHLVSIPEAEMLKSVENAWHATKIVFANEIGRLSESLGLDGSSVMELLMLDTRQNISRTYLRPGFAFGGSCLPKDVRSLARIANLHAVETPLLSSLLASNKAQIDKAENLILSSKGSRVGFLGLAFKANTDDIRESPSLELIQRLIGRGHDVLVHDFEAFRHDLYGSNLAEADTHPHIRRLMVSNPLEIIDQCQIVVLTQHNKKYIDVLAGVAQETLVIDLPNLLR